MAAFPAFPSLSVRVSPLLPPVAALVCGAAVAATFALAPTMVLEDWVWRSGIPALVAAAAPPLGTTARTVLALAGGALTAAVVWSMLYLLVGPGGLLVPKTPANAVPVVRRADAHRDAPPRRPMTAADLGTPLMEVAPTPPVPPVERAVPADLDQPLSAFDPAAIPDVPLPLPVKVAPMRPMLAPGERIDTFVLPAPTPPDPAPPPPPALPRRHPETPPTTGNLPSIDALLARLEERAAHRMRRVAG